MHGVTMKKKHTIQFFTNIYYFPFASSVITSFLNSRPMLITTFITDHRSMCVQVSEGFIEIIT